MKDQTSSRFTHQSSRRKVALGATALTAAFLLPHFAIAAANPTGTTKIGDVTMNSVQFKNNTINMAGNIYSPKDFNKAGKYAAVVVVHPGGGVKEQAAGLYAQKLAQQGFVVLTFDASHQGASGGMPRFLENPTERVEDVRSAVDYLTTLAYVDPQRIGALGICAGGGYAIKAATIEHRIKAVATVSAVDIGAATRKGWDGKGSEADQIAMLDEVAKQRTAEAAGAKPKYVTYVPVTPDSTTPSDLREASDYYLTARGQHPGAPNKMLFTSLDKMLSFTALDQVNSLLVQPSLMIAGSNAGSLWHSQEAYQKAKGEKELFIVDGATHMTLYDGEKHVGQALGKLTPFFKRNLSTAG
ncbi:alpha/beta hydrolase [Noviherbaspirillum sp.]|uniref:alpha/beta hydrolase n=1 Tax=Noviherbaspirillum sp. TaxID=1926288 RepID=UPI002FE4003A